MTTPSATPPPDSDAAKIARGEQVVWTGTFDHPQFGELTFEGVLPKAPILLEHSVQMDNLLANLDGAPRASTMILVAALAGMSPLEDTPGQGLLMKMPVVEERRTETDEKVTVERVYYDPTNEQNVGWLSDVWLAYSAWRSGLLTQLDAVKGPSGETIGDDSNEPSSVPTVSPSTTLD